MKIIKKFINPNAVADEKILLDNGDYLRGRNAANNADVNIIRVNSSDQLEFASVPRQNGKLLVTEGRFTTRTFFTPTVSDGTNMSVARGWWWRHAEQVFMDLHFEFNGTTGVAANVWYVDTPTIDSVQIQPATADMGGNGGTDNWKLDLYGVGRWYQPAAGAYKVVHAIRDPNDSKRIRFNENPGYITANQLVLSGGNTALLHFKGISFPVDGWS